MKNKVILLSMACASLLNAETIKSIDFINLNKISPQIAKETLNMRVGETINKHRLNNAIKNFYDYGYFSDITAKNDDGALKIYFKENPSIANIDIKGYKSRSNDIKALKDMTRLKRGSMFTKQRINEAKKTLLKMLESEGYINSVINVKVTPINKNAVSILFDVVKGDKIIIKKAKYHGAKNLDADDFDKVTANKEKEFASWWFGQNDGEVKLEQLKYDAKRINDLYYEKGYLDATVKEPFLDIDFASNEAQLNFYINEGEKYTTNNIKLYVDPSLSDAEDLYTELAIEEELYSRLSSKEGEFFNIKKVRKDVEYIRTQIANKGYAFVDVSFDMKKDKKNHKVAILFNIIPGKKTYINDVKISGNNITLDRVIRRNIYLAPGDTYSLDELQDSKSKLKRSGFFKGVNLEGKRVSDDKIDIIAEVQETPTGSIVLGGGYGSYDKLMFNASVSDKNIFGSGLSTSLSTQLSKHSTDFSLNVANPNIFDSKYNGFFDVHINKNDINRSSYKEDKKVKGFSIGAGREIARNLYVGANYRLDFIKEKYTYSDPYLEKQQDGSTKEVIRKGNKNYFQNAYYKTSSITPYINFDNTDDYYVPRKGFKIGSSLEYAGLGGDSKYLRSNSYLKYFYSLENMTDLDWIFRFKTQVKLLLDKGQINQGDSLYLGGPRNLRGYKSYSFGPGNQGGWNADKPYKKLWSNSVELSFPLIPETNMRWALFYDYAMTGKEDFKEIKRSSTGALIEWISPIGPLQLIFAKPLHVKDEDKDKTSSFEFSLGASF